MPAESDHACAPKQLHDEVARYLECVGESGLADDIVFQNLSVEGAGQSVQEAPTVPIAFASLFKSLNPLQYLRPPSEPSRMLLNGLNGRIRPGELVLVIAKPGGGCSTTLRTLAGMRNQFKSTSGRLAYAGKSLDEYASSKPGSLAYCGEQDLHFTSLSVYTTLKFAVESKTALNLACRADRIKREVNALAALLGLSDILSSPIDLISGGQRRRVSLAESLVTHADLLCFDNPTAGLDSSTALHFVQLIRTYVDQRQSACVMAVYQASDALCRLFDKVLVISKGSQIYYGPLAKADSYFESLGFDRPPGTTLSDFLTIMSGDAASWTPRVGQIGPVPHCGEDLATAYKNSSYYDIPDFAIGQHGLGVKTARTPASEYILPMWRQVYLCAIRQLQILVTDKSAWVTESIATVLQALVIGTVFYNERALTQSLYSTGSVLFLSVLAVALRAAAELRATFSQRPLLLRQRHLHFYRPASYAIGQVIADMPWKVLSVIYNVPLYFMAHLQWNPGHFFIWFLSLYLAFQAISLMFRAIAVFTIAPDRAALPVGLWLNVLVIYAGFYVPIPDMKVWLGWLRFLSPMHLAYESMMIDQFWNMEYSCSDNMVAPFGPEYVSPRYQTCSVPGSVPGRLDVTGRSHLHSQYSFQKSHLWRNIGINAGYFLFFMICTAYGMERFKPAAGRLATVFYKQGALPSQGVIKASDIESSESASEPMSLSEHGLELHDRRPKSQDVTPAHFRPMSQTGHVLAWKDLTLDVKVNTGTKRLLDCVSAWTKPGLTALMGGSGAGKTTLMNILVQSSSTGVVSGNLYLNGGPLPKTIKRRMGYVNQQDVHLPSSTVREALQTAARLRQSSRIAVAEKLAYVENIINMLDMQDIADALIGTAGAGLSLEKRKRVSIGVELAARPDTVLFLDEPTSGLDSDSALAIIRLLRKIADSGQAILCVIHQPAAQLITQFDNLLLLVPGGKVAYFGEMGHHCATAAGYFEKHTRQLGSDENPAEYFIDVATRSSEDGRGWDQIWKTSPEFERINTEIGKMVASSASEKSTESLQDSSIARPFAASYLEQFKVIQYRAFLNYWREPTYAVSKILMVLFNALLNGLTFLQLDTTVQDARGRVFTMFVATITAPPQMVQLEPRFHALRSIFLAREKANNSYHWSIFVLTAIIAELPYALTAGTIYWVVWYYTVGLPSPSSRSAYSWLLYELYTLFYTALGQAIAATMPTLSSALLVTPFVFVVVNLFAGPLTPRPVTPSGWRWFFNISPQFYLIECMETDFLHDVKLSCTAQDVVTFAAPANQTCADYAAAFLARATGYLLNPHATAACQYCPYADGGGYLRQYDFEWKNRGRSVGAYIGFICFNWPVVFAATYLLFIKQWRKKRA